MIKCHNCHIVINEKRDSCPLCGGRVEEMCCVDHLCTCLGDISSGITYCPTCGKAMCPCGNHDVSVVSRVTGYLSDVKGWNAAKKQELVDRQRY